MTYVILPTVNTGDLITAADWNQVGDNFDQLASLTHGGTALSSVAAGKEIGWYVGDLKNSFTKSDQSNKWLRCDGRTIGNASSSATARANADMETLFTHLWTNSANTELAIQDSSGGASTRGASAAADWAANKRMPLPDLRGRVFIMLDDPTGSSAANRVTSAQADVVGGTMGAETVTLALANLPTTVMYNNAGGAAFGSSGGGNISANSGGGSTTNLMQPTYAGGITLIYTGN